MDWSCSEYIQYGRKTYTSKKQKEISNPDRGCDCTHIKEEDPENILYEISEKYIKVNMTSIIGKFKRLFLKSTDNIDYDDEKLKQDVELKKVNNQSNVLLDKLLDGVINEDRLKGFEEIFLSTYEKEAVINKRPAQCC
ncbi:MAG: hypothetical protein ACOYJC_06335 [Christensenellales bacterium]